jgi:transposase-like protein
MDQRVSAMIEVIACPRCRRGLIAPIEAEVAQVKCPSCGWTWGLSNHSPQQIADATPAKAVVVDAFGVAWTAEEILANAG